MEHESKLAIPSALWEVLLGELHRRTEERHESGAFLVGHLGENNRRVVEAVYYDDLDHNAYRWGIVVMHAVSFGSALGSLPVKRPVGRCRHPCPSKGRVPESR